MRPALRDATKLVLGVPRRMGLLGCRNEPTSANFIRERCNVLLGREKDAAPPPLGGSTAFARKPSGLRAPAHANMALPHIRAEARPVREPGGRYGRMGVRRRCLVRLVVLNRPPGDFPGDNIGQLIRSSDGPSIRHTVRKLMPRLRLRSLRLLCGRTLREATPQVRRDQ